MGKNFLLVISDREPLAWILATSRMAFSAGRISLAGQLSVDDRLFLYTTRGCFHNPTRDRGRVIGEATVASEVKPLPKPVDFGETSFPVGCDLIVMGLAAKGSGPVLADLVCKLNVFPDPRSWSARMRRVLVPLDPHDAELIRAELAALMLPPEVHRIDYTRDLIP
jgi:hypothetical protein